MSTRNKNVPQQSGNGGKYIARASSALVALETKEPEAVRLIRSIGKDPEFKLTSELADQLRALYGEGQRGSRRTWLLERSVRYLFDGGEWREERVLRVLGGLRARTKVMVDYMVAFWDGEYRPKTWVDALSPEDQNRWVAKKRAYSRKIESLNRDLDLAKAAYAEKIREIQTEQLAARFELQDFLRELGVKDAPLLRGRTDQDLFDELSEELVELGVSTKTFQDVEDDTLRQH